LRRRLVQAGRQTVLEKFTLERMVVERHLKGVSPTMHGRSTPHAPAWPGARPRRIASFSRGRPAPPECSAPGPPLCLACAEIGFRLDPIIAFHVLWHHVAPARSADGRLGRRSHRGVRRQGCRALIVSEHPCRENHADPILTNMYLKRAGERGVVSASGGGFRSEAMRPWY
jgi:hypothetical protein